MPCFLVAVLALGQAMGALGQAEKQPPATTAMKAVVDQVEADWVDGRWANTEVGPFLASTILTPRGRVDKGIAIKVGDKATGHGLLQHRTAWVQRRLDRGIFEYEGQSLRLDELAGPEGGHDFVNGNAVGWAHGSDWNDPRANRRGPCPGTGPSIADCIGTANGWHSITRWGTPQFSSHPGPARSAGNRSSRARLKLAPEPNRFPALSPPTQHDRHLG